MLATWYLVANALLLTPAPHAHRLLSSDSCASFWKKRLHASASSAGTPAAAMLLNLKMAPGAKAHLHLEGLQVQIEGLQEEGEREWLVGPHLLQCLRGGHEIGPTALAPCVVARQGVEIAATQAQRVVVVEKLRLSPRANQHVEAAGEQRVRDRVLQHGRGDRHLVGLQKGEEPRQVGVVRELHGGVHHQHVLGGDGRGSAEGERGE